MGRFGGEGVVRGREWVVVGEAAVGLGGGGFVVVERGG